MNRTETAEKRLKRIEVLEQKHMIIRLYTTDAVCV